MDNSIHALLIAQQAKDRIDEATAARELRAVKSTRLRTPKPALRHWLRRRTPAEVAAPTAFGPLQPR